MAFCVSANFFKSPCPAAIKQCFAMCILLTLNKINHCMKKVFAFLFMLAAITTITHAQNNTSGKLLRHVVLFRFKEGTTGADIKKVEEAFRALPSKISEVKAFEWGTNNSPEGLNDGFTHCFFVSFNSEQDRAVYLPHPAHQAFVTVLKPYLDKALVLDYWAGQ
jgi:hypothetical protein